MKKLLAVACSVIALSCFAQNSVVVSGGSTITINGKTVQGKNGGSSIVVNGDKVYVDGVEYSADAKDVRVEVRGDVKSLSINSCNSTSVLGNVGGLSITSGNARVMGSVGGDVNVRAGNVTVSGGVGGNATSSAGNVNISK